MALFHSGRSWQNRPDSCCHPKIATDLEASKGTSDAATLFILLYEMQCHTRSCWHQSPQVAHSTPSLPHGQGWFEWISVTNNNTAALIRSQVSSGNVKKRVHTVNAVSCWAALSGKYVIIKQALNSAGHVGEKCSHHFRMKHFCSRSTTISNDGRAQVLAKVFYLSLFLFPPPSSYKKLFRVAGLITNLSEKEGAEFLHLMKVTFWPSSVLFSPVTAPQLRQVLVTGVEPNINSFTPSSILRNLRYEILVLCV